MDRCSRERKAHRWMRSLSDALRPYSSNGYLVNFLGDEEPDTVRAAFGSNHARLVELKTKYDPTNFFSLNQNAGLMFQRGVAPEATLLFKHALVQDTAYSMLLRGPRQALHARIARALETFSPELVDSQPELFAQHYAEAGLVEKSVDYWGKAGHRSAACSAI